MTKLVYEWSLRNIDSRRCSPTLMEMWNVIKTTMHEWSRWRPCFTQRTKRKLWANQESNSFGLKNMGSPRGVEVINSRIIFAVFGQTDGDHDRSITIERQGWCHDFDVFFVILRIPLTNPVFVKNLQRWLFVRNRTYFELMCFELKGFLR